MGVVGLYHILHVSWMCYGSNSAVMSHLVFENNCVIGQNCEVGMVDQKCRLSCCRKF